MASCRVILKKLLYDGRIKQWEYDKLLRNLKNESTSDKSECEHDHEILNAHSEGARQMLDIIRAEIVKLQNDYPEYWWVYSDAIEIIDKYM